MNKTATRKKPASSTVFWILADGLDASVHPRRGWGKEHEAARRLADAAPEMLAALNEIVRMTGRFGGMQGAIRDAAEAAIAKAGPQTGTKTDPLRVGVKVEGGVVEVYRVPPGVAVEVIDHDVDGNPEEDNELACRCEEGGGTYHSHWTETGGVRP